MGYAHAAAVTNLNKRLQADYAVLQGKLKSIGTRRSSIQRLQHLLAPHLPIPNMHALDLGAGQGELVEALHMLGCHGALGVELSHSQVQQAQIHGCCAVQQGEGLKTLQAQQDGSLDLVVCFDVFEHLTHEVCASWFDQIQRVLRPGGRLIGHVPNGLSPFSGFVYWGDLTHLWCPVPESMQVFCRASGLHWIGAFENIGASNTLKGNLRSLAWQSVRFLLAGASTIETGRNAFILPWSRTFLFVAERQQP